MRCQSHRCGLALDASWLIGRRRQFDEMKTIYRVMHGGHEFVGGQPSDLLIHRQGGDPYTVTIFDLAGRQVVAPWSVPAASDGEPFGGQKP